MAATETSAARAWHRLVRDLVQSSRSTLRAGVDFLLPPTCLLCRSEMESQSVPMPEFCTDCRERLRPLPGPECTICAAPVGPYLETKQGCLHCRNDRFRFDRVIRLGVYRDRLRSAILQAKAVSGEALARGLAGLLFTEKLSEWRHMDCDLVVPVPKFWTRRFAPGHFASETLAEELARRLHLPCDHRLLRKTRWTPAQSGSPPSVRRMQQRNAFAAARDARGRTILLVDDVLTTGATADEASKALLAAGASRVTVAVIARGIGEQG